MSNLKLAWQPKTKGLTETERRVLAVTATPSKATLPDLLGAKLQALVDLDPEAAAAALEMSADQAPELWEVAQDQAPGQWGRAIAASDGMMALLAKLDWKQEAASLAAKTAHQPATLLEVVETLA